MAPSRPGVMAVPVAVPAILESLEESDSSSESTEPSTTLALHRKDSASVRAGAARARFKLVLPVLLMLLRVLRVLGAADGTSALSRLRADGIGRRVAVPPKAALAWLLIHEAEKQTQKDELEKVVKAAKSNPT